MFALCFKIVKSFCCSFVFEVLGGRQKLTFDFLKITLEIFALFLNYNIFLYGDFGECVDFCRINNKRKKLHVTFVQLGLTKIKQARHLVSHVHQGHFKTKQDKIHAILVQLEIFKTNKVSQLVFHAL